MSPRCRLSLHTKAGKAGLAICVLAVAAAAFHAGREAEQRRTGAALEALMGSMRLMLEQRGRSSGFAMAVAAADRSAGALAIDRTDGGIQLRDGDRVIAWLPLLPGSAFAINPSSRQLILTIPLAKLGTRDCMSAVLDYHDPLLAQRHDLLDAAGTILATFDPTSQRPVTPTRAAELCTADRSKAVITHSVKLAPPPSGARGEEVDASRRH
jgi:hypothetical protein